MLPGAEHRIGASFRICGIFRVVRPGNCRRRPKGDPRGRTSRNGEAQFGRTRGAAMNTLRFAPAATASCSDGCCRCAQAGEGWDRVAAKAYCPQCEEQLAAGEMEPLVEPTQPRTCVICSRGGTVCYT